MRVGGGWVGGWVWEAKAQSSAGRLAPALMEAGVRGRETGDTRLTALPHHKLTDAWSLAFSAALMRWKIYSWRIAPRSATTTGIHVLGSDEATMAVLPLPALARA